MKKLLLITLALVIAAWAFAQTDITIGTGTSTGRYPFNDYFVYSRSQCIYLESEIGYPGTIHKLRWYRSDTGADPNAIGTTQIWLKTVPNAVFADANWEDPGTLVYEIANIDLGAGGGWYEVDITDFNYTGGNLVVSVYTQDAPYTTPHSYWYYTATTGYNRCRLGNSDSTNPPTLSLSTSRPNIQINMTTSDPTSAPNPAVLVSPGNGAWAMIGDILSWNSGGGFPSSYDVYFGTSSTPPLVSDNQTALNYTPTLATGNTYYWKVVPANAFGEATGCPTWSFKTPTATQLAESFENTAFPPAGWANPGTWSRSTSYAKQGVASAYKYGSTSTQYILSTPKVTITSTSTLDLWTLCSTTTGTLQIVYSPDRTTWTQIGSNITHAVTYTWYNTVVDLSSLAGNNYYLGIRTGLQSASFYIDLVVGPEITPEAPGAPTLSVPADLATGVNEYIQFTWTAPTTGGVPTGYKLYCDTNNPPTTLIADLNALTYTLTTPLAYNTTYYWTVLAYNGSGNGPTATVRSFTTRTDPTITSIPYTEGFEVGNTDSSTNIANWSQEVGPEYTSYYWTANSSQTSYNRTPRTGDFNVTLHYSGAAWLFRPVNLTGGVAYELEAYARQDGATSTNATLGLYYGTAPTIAAMTSITGQVGIINGDYQRIFGHFTPATSGIYYLGIKGWLNSSPWYISLDDITIREAPVEPVFSYTPTSINFGLMQQNVTSAPVNITVTNTGGGTLNLSSSDIIITGPNAAMFSFNSDNLPATLGAGQSVNIPVSVTVTQEGPVSATLTITYNDTPYNVALSAEGLPVGIVIIGTGTLTQRQPFGIWFGYERSAALYTNAQIGSYGLLNKVAWNCATVSSNAVPYKIYAMQTNDTALTSITWSDFVATATLVDTGTHTFNTTGWYLFELTTPFTYTSGNLVIGVETYFGGSGTSPYPYFYYTSGTTGCHQYWNQDNTPPTSTGTLNTSLPNVMLQFGELPSGAPDPVTLNYPVNGATGIPQTGFNLTWTRALTGGIPSYYAVYMSQDEDTIYDDYYWETTNTSFNPVTEGGITFNYLDRWYWTVEAINDDGSAIVVPPYSFEIMADPRVNIPYAQDFGTNGTWPLNWTQTYSGGVTSNRWTLSNTNNAGGTAYEMKASWASGTGISRLIAPPINTDGIANFAINFNTYYNDYGAGITAKVQYSFDLNTWYDTPWSIISGSGDVTGNQTALITGLVNHPTTYVAWVLDGNHYQFNYWYIDDVAISLPHNHDVTVVSYDVENQVVPENTVVTPMATVGNNGLNTETFTVTCTIGTYTNTQTVTGLALGATQQVTFTPLTPALWTAESVVITTNLVGDEVPDNNTLYDALICLPLNVTGLANNAQTDQFVQFNLANPGILNALPNGYTGSYFITGADWKNGQWMGVEYDDGTLATDNYVNIDPLTGIYTDEGDLGAAIMGNAWDDTHDIMYGVSSAGYLYVMNPTTGAIGVGDSLWYNLEGTNYSIANLGGLMIDIAYDNTNNILYGIDLGNDCLWTINPATYELTLVGFLGIDLNYAQDAAFDQDSGLLYLAGYAGGGALYWIDTTYGGAYKVGKFTASGYELTAFAIPYGTLATAPVATISGTGQLSWTPVTGAVAYNVYSADDPYGTYTLEATVRGTTYTGPTAPKKFYKVTAVGGRQQTNHQEIRFREPIKHNGKLNQNDRYEFGPVNGFSMRSK